MARYALILAAFTGFVLSAVSGIVIVPFLHKLHFGQTIKEIGPTWHNKKQGTPTMGGLCFIFASTVAVALATLSLLHSAPDLLGGPTARSLYIAMFSAFAFGMVGFLDDFIKVVKKRNLGLRAMQKIVAQLLITTALLFALHMNGTLTTFVTLPGLGYVDLGLLYYPLSYGLIIGIVNAVNLTDGIDGLCSCVTFVSMLGFLTLTSLLGEFNLSIFAAAWRARSPVFCSGTSIRPRPSWATPAACSWAARWRASPTPWAGRSSSSSLARCISGRPPRWSSRSLISS